MEKNDLKEEMDTPLYKGGKVTKYHLDIVSGYVEDLIKGDLNNKQMLAILNERAEKDGKAIIKHSDTIKKIVGIILQNQPHKLQEYENTLKCNTNGKALVYKSKDEEFKRKVINEYLPMILDGNITLKGVSQELDCDYTIIDKIIKQYYLELNDDEKMKQYQERKKKNSDKSEKSEEKSKKVEEMQQYDVVSNTMFILMSEEEQEKQVLMKIRLQKLKSNEYAASIDSIMKDIDRIKEYFGGKNDYEHRKIYFTDEDIRCMIFKYPTLINRSNENLDEKIRNLLSYDVIDEQTAYKMILNFPAIMGYNVNRTKGQLDLLRRENLLDYAINNTSSLMRSEELIYALIQYAKDKFKTQDLSDVPRSSIFISNQRLKREKGISYTELKMLYKYSNVLQDTDEPYTVNAQDIGKVDFSDVEVIDADKVDGLISELIFKETQIEQNY